MTNQPNGLEAMLCYDIYATNLAFGRLYKQQLDPLGLTYPQYLVLTILWKNDEMTVSGIGAAMGLESSTLTPLIKRLETADLVTRMRDTKDERKVRVSLTPKGRALKTDAQTIPNCIAEATSLSIAEIEKLQSLLGALRGSLGDAVKG